MNNTTEPRVSVIVPTYNADLTIEKCLESILNQDYPNLEVIVVDDASIDDTVKKVSKFRVKIFSNQNNCGAAHSRNVGVENADSEIVVFIDSDVTVPSDAISKVRDRFLEYPNILAVGGIYSEKSRGLNFISDFKNLEMAYRGCLNPLYVKYLGSLFLAIKKDTFRNAGGFSTDFPSSSVEDIEFGYRVSKGKAVMLSDSNIKVDHLKVYTIFSMSKMIFRRIFNMLKIIRASKGKYKAGEHAPLAYKINIIMPVLIFLSFTIGILFDIKWLCLLFMLIFLANNVKFFNYLINIRGIIFAIKSSFALFFVFIVVDYSIIITLFTNLIRPVKTE